LLPRESAPELDYDAVSLLAVTVRADGAAMIVRDKTAAAESLDKMPGITMTASRKSVADFCDSYIPFTKNPGLFGVNAAEAVLTGARLRLANAAQDANGWLRAISAGQAAAAIKAEARGLSHGYDVIHPNVRAPKEIAAGFGWWAWRLLCAAVGAA
jgi:hypothetical protein